jgi:hypothetical protein
MSTILAQNISRDHYLIYSEILYPELNLMEVKESQMNLICSNIDASITKLLLDKLLGVKDFLPNQPQEAQYP